MDAVLSDNGREYRHPYELFLQLEDIEHKRTRSTGHNPMA